MGLFDRLFNKSNNETEMTNVVLSPCKGTLVALENVEDEVFSSKAMGDGIAVEPTEGIVTAPVSGKIVTLFPTGHAFGIATEDGKELLVHIGIDTVELNGQGFKAVKKQGDTVKAGDVVVKVDLQAVKNAGFKTTTMLIQTDQAFSQTKTVEPGTVVDNNTTVLKMNQ